MKIFNEEKQEVMQTHPHSLFLDLGKKIDPAHFFQYLSSLGYSEHDSLHLLFNFSDILKEEGLLDEALRLLTKAAEIYPSHPAVLLRIQLISETRKAYKKFAYLLKERLIHKSQLDRAVSVSIKSKNKRTVEFLLITNFKIDKKQVGQALSEYYKCEFVDFDDNINVDPILMSNSHKEDLLEYCYIPMRKDGDKVRIVIDDPIDFGRISKIAVQLKSKNLETLVGIREDIIGFIEKYFNDTSGALVLPSTIDLASGIVLPEITKEEVHVEEEPEVTTISGEIVRLVDSVILLAKEKMASDIHIEPSVSDKCIYVRFRIDGVMTTVSTLPLKVAGAFLNRLKIMANLDISERRLPQDGKIVFRRKGIEPFELRLATLPTSGGYEDAVLRVLNKAGILKLEDMGLLPGILERLKKVISAPYGIVLAVGPTGSGKTTTLHAILAELNKPGVKIWTAEDPVEITHPGLRQVEVKPRIGLDFARVMRSFLRADPDIIMVGEMRDQETASVAIEASLTGHLVLSTLHTNSAPETVTRLIEMGMNPLNLSDSLLGILAQRLLRRLCPQCKTPYRPSEDEYSQLMDELSSVPKDLLPEITADTVLFRPGGCQHCLNTGYRGRIGIYELMVATPEIKSMIKARAETEKLLKQAQKGGMLTLRQDAIIKAFQGITSIEEIKRVVVWT